MTLRSRLVTAVTLLTFVSLGVAFIIVSIENNRWQERRLDAALVAQALQDAILAVPADGGEPTISDKPLTAANDVGPLAKFGAIYGRDGEVKVLTTSFAKGAPPLGTIRRRNEGPFDFWYEDEHLRGVFTPLPARTEDVLLLAASRAELDGDAAFLRRAMVIAFIVAVSWTATVATWVVRRLTREHQKIADVANRVAAGDLTARVRPGLGDDELSMLGRNIDDMIAQLEVLVESQKKFIALAAHELRTPLTTVYGELSHALRRSRDAASYRLAVEEAMISTRRLKLLAEDLLTLARIGADRKVPREPVSVNEVVGAVLAQLDVQAHERQVALVVDVDDLTIQGDAGDIARMIRNLIDNALRHSPEGGRVVVSAHAIAESARITVADTGPGVPIEVRDKIFEPFFRGNHDAIDPGAGLGLAIVRQIARAHGGDVRTVPAPDKKGACFEVSLPLSSVASARPIKAGEKGSVLKND